MRSRRASRSPSPSPSYQRPPSSHQNRCSNLAGHDRVFGLDGLNLDALSRLEGAVAVVSGGASERRGSVLTFDERTMYAAGLRYEDIVRAVDVVVSKPGYGIIAECLANDTALLYTSRGHFIEYDVLVADMPRFLRAAHIDHADLFAGRWAPHVDALLTQSAPPERPAVNGADAAAEYVLTM